MFLGEYFHTLDDKGRVVMPASFRRQLAEGCVVAKGRDGQLQVHRTEDFARMAQEIVAGPQDRKARMLARTMFAGADQQELDKSGRLLVKPDLRDFAGFQPGSEIVVIGVFDHVELWEKDRYLEDRAAGDQTYVDEDE